MFYTDVLIISISVVTQFIETGYKSVSVYHLKRKKAIKKTNQKEKKRKFEKTDKFLDIKKARESERVGERKTI